MFSSLLTTLFLGVVAGAAPPKPVPPPGIEVVHIAAPSPVRLPLHIPTLSASGVLLLDAESGEELYSYHADDIRPMASLTKLMTALILAENHRMEELVTIPPIAEDIRGSTIGIKAGDRLRVGDLLHALLLPSANDAAYALASFHGHGVSNFVQEMNERAKSLGLLSTKFQNPAGLDHPDQYSNARDLAWLTLAALKQPILADIVQKKHVTITSDNGEIYALDNTNEMLKEHDVLGVKTGTTAAAKECLIVMWEEEKRTYLLVLLGSLDRYRDSERVRAAVTTLLASR